ncbi:hypothetical protein K7432_018460, partial [Basidiobolus ranarum]
MILSKYIVYGLRLDKIVALQMESLIVSCFILLSFFLLFVLVLLLGPKTNSRTNFFGWLYSSLVEEFANDISHLLVPILGRRQIQNIQRLYSYLILEANPLLQSLYFIL